VYSSHKRYLLSVKVVAEFNGRAEARQDVDRKHPKEKNVNSPHVVCTPCGIPLPARKASASHLCNCQKRNESTVIGLSLCGGRILLYVLDGKGGGKGEQGIH